MKPSLIPAAFAVLSTASAAPDPVHSDGDKYKVLLENDQVRVLAYRDQPGEKTHLHQHPGFVLYALAPFKRNIGLADGRSFEREFKAGDVLYSDAQTHFGENTGTTPTEVIMVEIKPERKATPQASGVTKR
jgi:quercetin dioxygenase-like cupin family protein